MRPFIYFLVCALFVVFLPTSSAANFTNRFEQLSIEQGLSQNTVTAIVQDSQGFLWFGTREGLNRFDGYRFKTFRHEPELPGSISDNYIWSLFEDEQGVLWIGTANGGLNRYDRNTERFEHFSLNPEQPDSLSDKGVRSIYQDSAGTLWIGTNEGGLNRFDAQAGSFQHWQHQPDDVDSISDNRVYAMVEGTRGQLWLATAKGINRFDIKRQHFTRFTHDPRDSNSLAHDRVRSLVKDERGRLWFGTDGGGLHRFDTKTESFERFAHIPGDNSSLGNDFINALYQENADTLWVGTWGGGLNRFDIATGRFSRYENDPSNSNSLSANLVYSLYKDNKGVLWVGTSGGGVNKFDTRTANFGHVRHERTEQGSLSENNVRALLQDSKGTLWVGTRGGGLNRLDKGSDNFIHYNHVPGDSNSLSNGQIYTLFEDSLGFIWVGTAAGLNRFDSNTGRFTLYAKTNGQNSISDNRIKHIIEDGPGILWIATHGGGLNRFDSNTGRFEVFRHQRHQPGSLSHDIVTRLLIDGKGVLWVATLGGGLNRFDRNTRLFEHFRHDPNEVASLSHDRVFTLHEDVNGNLWAGTARGLNKLLVAQNRFKRFLPKDGLAGDVVLAILEDNRGHLWVSGNNGLSRLNNIKQTFRTFDANDGLQSNEFNLNAAFKTPEGELLFGGINGFNRFSPESIVEDTVLPPVHITGFLLSNKPVPVNIESKDNTAFTLEKAINALDELKLTHKQTLVTFEFAALDYANPLKNRYAYRLEGYDEDWIATDASRRFATYTRLDPGQYVFHVKASNKDGYWNEQGKRLAVLVLPPWYKTWQAYIAYVLLVVGSIVLFFRYRTRALVKRAEQLEKKVKQRTETINQLMEQKHRMFANVSHEFKTPLTLILNPIESMAKDPAAAPFARKLSMIRRNGQRLLRMVEQLLELSKLENRPSEQQFNYYSLADTLGSLLTSYQPLMDSKQLTLHHETYKDVVLHLTTDSLEMILSNLISNAVKYTPTGGRIVVMVKADDKKVLVAVSDSGIGIDLKDQEIIFNRFTRANESHDEAIPGAGIGLALVKELVEVNRGSIGLVSQPGKGSTFTVTLPICKERDMPLASFQGTATQAILDMQRDESMPVLSEVEAAKVPAGNPKAATVLVIDDNTDMLQLLDDTLKGHYQCVCAAGGEKGLALAKELLPDVVISDLMMPDISGFDVLKQLKQSSLTDHIPVILLTAKGDTQSRIKGWSEKADEYLNKPFNPDELLSRIENLLAIRSLLRKRYHQSIEPDQNNNDKLKAQSKLSEPEHPTGEQSTVGVNQVFFDKVYLVLEKYYAEESLDVSFLADQLAMSQRQLGRKMKAVLDYTPTELIRIFRLKKAAELLKQGEAPSTVAHKVGFSSHSYFSQCFKAQFDCLPSSYR